MATTTTSTMFREFTSGYVSRVELENFKSWKGTQHIGPFHSGFTAVIGPNGAGKSNLMDSISFVTGLKAKRLRGDALKDLIYDADKLAEEENRKMSVTMAYRLGEGEVPGKRAGEEIVFKRAVQYHTPGCEYYIGSRHVTHAEYEEMFNQLNVLTSARNFLIFQGDVEATAAKSPADLALLFEQISGSDKYKLEYERLEKEKDRVDTVTLDRIAQAKLAKQERKEAKEAKEVTDRFNSLAAQCEQVGQEFALFQLQQAEEEMHAVRGRLEQAKDQVAELEAVEEASAEDAKQQKAKVALEARALAKSEAALVDHSKSRNALQQQFAKKNEAAQREKAKRKELQEQLNKAKDALESQSAKAELLHQQIASFVLREKDLQEEIDQLLGGEEEEEELPARSNSQRAEADEATGELKSEEANLKIQLSTLTGRLQVAGSNLAQLESRVSESLASKQDWQRKRQSAEKRLGELLQAQAKLEKLVQERQSELDSAAKTLEAKRQELAEAKRVLGANAAKATENLQSKRLRDMVAALASHFPGVRGRLVDLVRPSAKKYALAVDTCLGRQMDSVVVETRQTAYDCIKYLRDNRLGKAVFLPLDSLQPKPISDARRKLAVGPYLLCYDLIVVEDEAVDAAVRFAAGDAMICETLEDARRLCIRNQVRVKAVTLEGHVISQRGEMTGGVLGDAGKQDRFAQAAAKLAKENCDRLEKEIGELERVLDGQRGGGGGGGEAQTELTACVGRVKFSQVTLKEAEDKASQIEARLEEYRLEREQAEFKKREIEADVARTQSALRGVRERIAEAENQVFEDEDQGGDRKRRRREVEQREAKQLELKPIKDQLVMLQSKLRFTANAANQNAVDQCRAQLEDTEAKIEQYVLDADEAKQKLDECVAKAQQLEAAKKRAMQQLELAEARAKELAAHLQSSLEAKSLAKKQVALAEGELQRATLKRAEVIKQSALDGVELPRLLPQEDEDEGEDRFDFAVLKRCKLKSEQEFAQRLAELREESASLLPNTRAEVRFQEASERLKDCDGNLQQSREQGQVAEEAFERVRERRKEAFMKMFSHVSQKIDSVYKELTKRANSPLGGSAFLALEDEEGAFTAGIKFECMPPNKRYRAMEQLSGGEKTIAALALLFAIHTFRPSPFFVLDEVDAALDNDNVERVSNYIKMRSNRHGNNEDEEFRPFQCLVISLKDGFFGRAEALVGVYRDLELDSSKPLTLDLSLYAEQ